jgi:hypothetical protein
MVATDRLRLLVDTVFPFRWRAAEAAVR